MLMMMHLGKPDKEIGRFMTEEEAKIEEEKIIMLQK